MVQTNKQLLPIIPWYFLPHFFHMFFPLCLQLSNQQTEILESLGLPENQSSIFSETQCCSDTEVSNEKVFQKVQCQWLSQGFSALGHQIDKTFDNMKAEKLGRRYENCQSMWMMRKPSNLQEKLTKVPTRLPSNCYHPDLISSLSPEGKQLLDMQPPIDLAFIISKLIP